MNDLDDCEKKVEPLKLKEKLANAKAYVQKNQRKFILMMCSIVVVGGIIAGTLAWLAAKTDPVINNFIGSNLEINLAEEAKNFQMIPHLEIPKDPMITVKANSEACWLFLQVKESNAQANGSGVLVNGVPRINNGNDFYKYLNYDIRIGTNEFNGWTKMTDQQVTAAGLCTVSDDQSVNTYYYRKVGTEGTAIASDEEILILEGDQVVVNDYIINDELSSTQLAANPVKITFTPIALQRLGFPSVVSAAAQIANEFH